MKDGTYQLRFKMTYTLHTKSGPFEIPFGESMTDSVTVGNLSSSGVKSGVKAFAPSSTIPGSSGRFTTTIPGSVVSSQVTTTVSGYSTGSDMTTVTSAGIRNFNTVTGLLWAVLLPVE